MTIASASILTASAIRTNDAPAFINPLDPLADKIFVIKNSVPLKAPSITPIAVKDFIIFSASIFAIELRATDRIAIAAAIPTSDATFIPVVNEESVSLTPPKISENCSFILDAFTPLKRFSMLSLTVFISPENFLAATNIPPPANPAKISPAETLSEIHVNTFFTTSKILLAEFTITVFTAENTSPSDSTFSRAGSTALIISFMVFSIPSDNVVKNFSVPALSLSDVKKSPIDADTFNNAFPTDANPPEPIKFLIGDVATANPRLIKFNAEKSPLKDRCILSLTSELYSRLNDKSCNFCIIPYKSSDVNSFGNISL